MRRRVMKEDLVAQDKSPVMRGISVNLKFVICNL